MINVPHFCMGTVASLLRSLADVVRQGDRMPEPHELLLLDDEEEDGWRSVFTLVEQPPDSSTSVGGKPTMLVVPVM